MEPLDPALRESVLESVLSHVAHFLAYVLAHDAVRRINLAGVQALSADLALVEAFETRSGVARRHLAEPRQLVSLLLDENVQEFMDLTVQRSRYRLLSNNMAQLLTIFEKWEHKSGLFASREAKARKENIAVLLEYLRQKVKS